MEPLERPRVDDAVGRNGGQTCVCHCGLGIGQLARGVCVAVECKDAAERQSLPCQREVHILSRGSPSISIATPRCAAASNTAPQFAMTPARDPVMRPRGCARMRTAECCIAASMRCVWSSFFRSFECGAASTTSKVAPSSSVRSRCPAALMFASMPCNRRKRPLYWPLTSSIARRCAAASAIDMPPAILSPYEWSVTAAYW